MFVLFILCRLFSQSLAAVVRSSYQHQWTWRLKTVWKLQGFPVLFPRKRGFIPHNITFVCVSVVYCSPKVNLENTNGEGDARGPDLVVVSTQLLTCQFTSTAVFFKLLHSHSRPRERRSATCVSAIYWLLIYWHPCSYSPQHTTHIYLECILLLYIWSLPKKWKFHNMFYLTLPEELNKNQILWWCEN